MFSQLISYIVWKLDAQTFAQRKLIYTVKNEPILKRAHTCRSVQPTSRAYTDVCLVFVFQRNTARDVTTIVVCLYADVHVMQVKSTGRQYEFPNIDMFGSGQPAALLMASIDVLIAQTQSL